MTQKAIGLDLGDVWIGIALSDALGISAQPHTTIRHEELPAFLTNILSSGTIRTVVVGLPVTLSGTESAQTKKIIVEFEQLKQQFANVAGHNIIWATWDERWTSKWAQSLAIARDKKQSDKKKEHATAAAFILQGYLDHTAFARSDE